MYDKRSLNLPQKFLAIGDVHGDLYALTRALGVARELELPPVILGDIVGGKADSACIQAIKEIYCIALRGNHDQWAVERANLSYSAADYEWLSKTLFQISNDDTLVLHTKFFRRSDGQVDWYQLQGALEVSDFLAENKKYRTILCAHTHLPAINLRRGCALEYISSRKLRENPKFILDGDQSLVDVGWASDNVVIFNSESSTPSVEFVFFQ